MQTTSLLLLLGAAAAVAILHSILPDHWVPLAVVARTQRWRLLQVVRISALASVGHVITSLILGGIIALIGLQFQRQIETQQGHIVGAILTLTGLVFLAWGLFGRGAHGHSHGEGHTHQHSFGHDHNHDHNHNYDHEHNHERNHNHDHDHEHDDHEHSHDHPMRKSATEQTLLRRLSAIAVPFGVAASPDLTILPVALAASTVGSVAVVSVLSIFSLLTVGAFIALTLIATIVGYQVKGAWLEKNANTITSLVLIGIGVIAYIGF